MKRRFIGQYTSLNSIGNTLIERPLKYPLRNCSISTYIHSYIHAYHVRFVHFLEQKNPQTLCRCWTNRKTKESHSQRGSFPLPIRFSGFPVFLSIFLWWRVKLNVELPPNWEQYLYDAVVYKVQEIAKPTGDENVLNEMEP